MSIKILYKGSIAKILISVLFLKIMLITDLLFFFKFMFIFVIIAHRLKISELDCIKPNGTITGE
jgi:hypothetical protein